MVQKVVDFFINMFQIIFYPDMFRHMVVILRGSWVPDKLLKQSGVAPSPLCGPKLVGNECVMTVVTQLHLGKSLLFSGIFPNIVVLRLSLHTHFLPATQAMFCVLGVCGLCADYVRTMTRPVWLVVVECSVQPSRFHNISFNTSLLLT
jgi:hypothetical protein